MAVSGNEKAHRSGSLKQKNKAHKHGKHRSNGQLDRECHGRVNAKGITKKSKHALSRTERRHQAQQLRKNKREELLARKRSRGGGTGSLPQFVMILPLCRGVEAAMALNLLKTCDETIVSQENEQGICHFSVSRFKQRLSFFSPPNHDLHAVMDTAKVADSILCLLSPDQGIDTYGEYCLSCLFAQGLPAVTLAVQGLRDIPKKKLVDARKRIQKSIEKRFPDTKFHSLDTSQDAILILRLMSGQKLRSVTYREARPHLVAENISFELENEECDVGTLKVTGYLRGQPLSVNSLIHLTGWGDFKMSQIDAPKDPYPLDLTMQKTQQKLDVDKGKGLSDMDEDVTVLEKCSHTKQESLVAEATVNPMEGEQTWPTEEEMAEVSDKKSTRRVPKGTSDYQAAWIIDDYEEDEEDADEESELSDNEEMVSLEGTSEDEQSNADENEEYETLTVCDEEDPAKYDAGIDMKEEKMTLEKLKEEKMNQQFPDEVDTPMHIPARTRFARFRGLRSFRLSPWDSKENLPLDYARIFQFENFKRTKKRVLSEERTEGARPGWFITIHVSDVPRTFIESYQPKMPVVLFGLLPYEQKMSVVHFLIKQHSREQNPVKSKERLIFHVGYRRFSACPIFSQHTTGNKQKYERFLPHNAATVATVFAPIMFPSIPVLVFRETASGRQDLVATGSLLSVNPDRVITKRSVLSGHPFKIHKKFAVVRYMFFNREDILWFKPVELRTKWGRRGHIKDPLGTHGHMKCLFDGHLKSQDTVLLNLYKRVFPKWTYEPCVSNPTMEMEFC